MRFASPNELRTIIREDLGFYNSVLVGGVYVFEDAKDGFTKPHFFIGPLKYCIDKHAALTVTVRDSHTEKAFYERVPMINLNNHIQVVQDDVLGDKELALDETTKIEQNFLSILRVPLPSTCPSWRVVILPLFASESSGRSCCLITFVFSHALGDGISGLAFHHTLLEAFRKPIHGEKSMFQYRNLDTSQPSCSRDLAPPLLRLAQLRLMSAQACSPLSPEIVKF